MNLVHTNAPFLTNERKLKHKKILNEKYEMINRDITHLLSELNHHFKKYEEKVNKELFDIKKNLTEALLNKNEKNIKKYSKEFIFSENELQLIKNFYLSKENIKDIFSINVYNNIVNKEHIIIDSNVIISKIQKFGQWVNLVKHSELLILWKELLELTIREILN